MKKRWEKKSSTSGMAIRAMESDHSAHPNARCRVVYSEEKRKTMEITR
jgi:hypothetical protein